MKMMEYQTFSFNHHERLFLNSNSVSAIDRNLYIRTMLWLMTLRVIQQLEWSLFLLLSVFQSEAENGSQSRRGLESHLWPAGPRTQSSEKC